MGRKVIDCQMHIIPDNYVSKLDFFQTQDAISIFDNSFQSHLCSTLNLFPVVSPIITEKGNGFQDDLSGSERPVEFDIHSLGKVVQILHDNCKWRRSIISSHDFALHTGVYSQLSAIIRRDEPVIDNIHSVLLNNATWEIRIDDTDRNEKYLKSVVNKAIQALYYTQEELCSKYSQLDKMIPSDVIKKVNFVSSFELEKMYPSLSSSERENAYGSQTKLFVLTKIGYPLISGAPHSFRTPDYDDWMLNFDIMLFYPPLRRTVEIGGGGIRVCKEEMEKQFKLANWTLDIEKEYHRKIMCGEMLPTIGGAFGTDRIKMIFLNKIHIGEVRPSIWDESSSLLL